MDKSRLHHLWTWIRPVKTWYLFVAFVAVAVVHVAALRSNYTQMATLRSAVYQADKDGSNIEGALQELRAFVNGHMNTSLDSGTGIYPPVHLKYTYERLVKAEQERVDAINSQVYTDAQKRCEELYPGSFSGGPRVPCIEQYVKANGASTHSIPDAQYKFDFASPSWSPDLAGWSQIFATALLLLTVVRLALGKWLKTVTK
ncbi:MAG TPA: hypothetical protein VIS56_01160 [Candidatus Saccharimonadales bacterium]